MTRLDVLLKKVYEVYPKLKDSNIFTESVIQYSEAMDKGMTEILRRLSLEEEKK